MTIRLFPALTLLALIAVVGLAVMRQPSLLPIVALGAAGSAAVGRIGLAAAGVVGAVTCFAFAGVAARAVGDVNQVAVAVMVVLAVALFPRLQLPRSVALPGALFVLVATVAGIFAARRSIEFGVRAWIALACAPASVVAVGGLLRPGVLSDERRDRARRWILGAVVVAIVANVLFALRQSFLGLSSAEVRSATTGESTFRVGDQIRLMGTFATNQDFGLFAACTTPALLVFSLQSHGRLRRGSGGLAAAMYLVTLLSLTRTALIASVLAGVVGVLVWGRGSITTRVARLVGVGVVVVGVLTLLLANVSSERLQDSLERADTLFDLGRDSSFQVRQDTNLPYALSLFGEHPLGLGAGAAGPVSQRFPDVAPSGTVTTDNGYLMIGLQLGVLGLALFVWMLLALAMHLGRSPRPMASATSAAIVALLLAMTIAGYWSLLSPIGVVGAVVGVAVADAVGAQPRQLGPPPADPSHLDRVHR